MFLRQPTTTLLSSTSLTFFPKPPLSHAAFVDFVRSQLPPQSSKNATIFGEHLVDTIWSLDAELDEIIADAKAAISNWSNEQDRSKSAEASSKVLRAKTNAESDKEMIQAMTSFTSSRSRLLRRSASSHSSASSMSITSGSSSLASLSNRCLQPSKILEADEAPIPPPKDDNPLKLGSKCAPSYGALAQGVKREKGLDESLRHERRISTSSCPSSDEEEKSRTERAKKQKTNVPSSAGCPKTPLKSPVKPLPSAPVLQRSTAQNGGHRTTTLGQRRALPMNLQRNPSILGRELPPLSTKS